MIKNAAISEEVYSHPRAMRADQKTLDDYWAFFTQPAGADMLPYIYMESSLLYDNLIKNCQDYYLCTDEVQVINKNLLKLKQHLHNITDIIEIGPGSVHAIQNKTLPILSCAQTLERYYGVDYSKNYLEEACGYIAKQRSELKILEIEADLMQPDCSHLLNITNKNKAILFLGSTLGNFRSLQQVHIIKQFSNITSAGDLLILSVDTNQDTASLLGAYDNIYANKFVTACLTYYAMLNPEFKKYLSSFELKTTLNNALSRIEYSFIVKEDLSFFFPNYGNIALKKGQELRGIISHKFTKENINKLLSAQQFKVLETLDHSGKMQLFICKRL